MIVTFRNGSAQQQAWFREAVEGSWPVWADPNYYSPFPDVARPSLAELNVAIEVEWVPDTDYPGTDEYALTSWTYDELGLTAVMQIDNELDNPASPKWQGKSFYQETVIHELSHLVVGRLLEEPQIQTLVGMFEGGSRDQWDSGPWDQRLVEASAELVKDALADPAMRRYPWYERTRRRLKLSGDTAFQGPNPPVPVEWVDFIELFHGGDSAHPNPSEAHELGPFQLPFVTVNVSPEDPRFDEAVWELTIGEVPARRNTSYVATVDLTQLDFRIRLNRLELSVYDQAGQLVAYNTVARNPGNFAQPPFRYRTTAAIGAGTIDPALRLGIFEPERLPLTAVVRFTTLNGSSFDRPEQLEASLTVNTFPLHPFQPFPGYEAPPSLVPSQITAYPARPGTRRSPRQIVGT